jgi:bacterioferritin
MKPQDPQIIEHLNRALKNELTAINQYFLHAKMLRNWGFGQLADRERSASIDEMKHADALMERILFLEGLPNVQDLGKLFIGQTVGEMFECDLKLEQAAVPSLRVSIAYCEGISDYVSRSLLEDILKSEEEHIDWLETQLELLQKVGEPNYLQSQMSGD